MKLGVIDLGTNSARLFVFSQRKSGDWRRVFKCKRMVRLGDNLFESRELSKAAIQRALKALAFFREQMQTYDLAGYRAVGTSALRSAKNGSDFLEQVEKKTKLTLEIISGKEEASLIAMGVISHFELSARKRVLVEIGGGSTEVSLVRNGLIQRSCSLKLGAARNQQMHLKSIPPRKSDIVELREHVREVLQSEFPDAKALKYRTAIGTSGSIRAIRRIATSYGFGKNGFQSEFLADFIVDLGVMKKKQIAALPHLEERRVDILLSATVILDEILKFFGTKKLRVTSCSLKDGILSELASQISA